MKKIFLIANILLFISGVTFAKSNTYSTYKKGKVLAFPGALGSGAYAKGGRGGRIIEVTNLNDRGPGSFREAVTATGPRIVVFRVGGTIELESEITLTRKNSFLTIAGQTAPGDGILISGHKMHYPEPWRGNLLEITDFAYEIVVRYIRLRVGRNQYTPRGEDKLTEQTGDCLTIWHYGGESIPMYNIVFDHCSFSWSNDENIQVSANLINATFQNNIISEGLNYNHPSCGVLTCQSLKANISLSFIRNYFAHNWNRNPWLAIKEAINVNNVVYNFGQEGMELKGGVKADVIANYFKPGPNTYNAKNEISIWDKEFCAHEGIPSVFLKNNYGPHSKANGNNWRMTKIKDMTISSIKRNRANTYWDKFPIDLISVTQLPGILLKDVGANKRLDENGNLIPNLDDVDKRVIGDFWDGGGKFLRDETYAGGFPVISSGTPYPDADHDGMSDTWELNNGLSPNNANDGSADLDGDGYTNIEEFLNATNPNWATSVTPVKPLPEVTFITAADGIRFNVGVDVKNAGLCKVYNVFGSVVRTILPQRTERDLFYFVKREGLTGQMYIVRINLGDRFFTQKILLQ